MTLPPLLAVSILFFAVADLWLAFPEIDLAVAGYFSTPGVGFEARGTLWEQLMYQSIDELLVIVGLGLIGAWAIGHWRQPPAAPPSPPCEPSTADQTPTPLAHRRSPSQAQDGRLDHGQPGQLSANVNGCAPPAEHSGAAAQARMPVIARLSQRVTGRRLSFLLLLLALVPGLIVNQVFKEHWGRARPIQIEQFGGNRLFTPPFIVSDQRGGSFVSGHVAAAAWLVAVAVLLAGWRSLWTLLSLAYLLNMALARIAAGAHFLSDALISIILVWLGYLLLQQLLGLDRPARASAQGQRVRA